MSEARQMAAPKEQMVAAARSLAWAFLLFSLLVQLPPDAHGICFFHAQAPCRYKEKPFAPGESWRGANCSKCFCLEPLGVGCCDMMQLPVDFPEGCQVRYDSRACQVSLVQKGRPHLPCANSLEPGWGSGQPPKHKDPRPPSPGKQSPHTAPGR
nr:prostate-associated microseminoprotein [Anolis sagrei ordinatus]